MGNNGQSAGAYASRIASTDEIRGHFPALERRCSGYPVAYFDGPGGTQVPTAVPEAMVEYLYHHNANRHWGFPASIETDDALEHAREVFATFLNATPREIVFGANMTTLTFHVSRALGRQFVAGDEIVVTELDHHANIDPWVALEADRGVRVRRARMIPGTGMLDWGHLAELVTDRTRLLAIGAAANSLGTINDVREAADLAHAAGAWVFVDGVHYAPHVLPDVDALGCDLFVCSPYKFYGPHLGVLFGDHALLETLDFPRLAPAGQRAPDRAETGTLSHEGIVGAAAGVEWLASLAGDGPLRVNLETVYGDLHRRGTEVFDVLWSGLAETSGVRLFGPPPASPRTPTVAFVVQNITPSAVASQLSARGLFTSYGDFYAQTVVQRLGLEPGGLVRAGCACYTTEEEARRFVDGVREVAE